MASPRYRPAKTAATVSRRSCAARPSGKKLVGNPGCREIVVYTYDYSDNLLTRDCAMTASTLIAPRFPRAAAVVVTVWLGLALLAGATGFLARLPFPGPQLIFLALFVSTLIAATGVPALRAWVDALPLRTLIGINAFRFIGITFLVLAARGQIDSVFAARAGWGDIATATLALILVAAGEPRTSLQRGLTHAWNALGFLDLVVAGGTKTEDTQQ